MNIPFVTSELHLYERVDGNPFRTFLQPGSVAALSVEVCVVTDVSLLEKAPECVDVVRRLEVEDVRDVGFVYACYMRVTGRGRYIAVGKRKKFSLHGSFHLMVLCTMQSMRVSALVLGCTVQLFVEKNNSRQCKGSVDRLLLFVEYGGDPLICEASPQ